MPAPSRRTRSIKRVATRLPGGRWTIHFKTKRRKTAKCQRCGLPLRGVPTGDVKSYPKSGRRPSRPYGGILCHNCLREKIRYAVRV